MSTFVAVRGTEENRFHGSALTATSVSPLSSPMYFHVLSTSTSTLDPRHSTLDLDLDLDLDTLSKYPWCTKRWDSPIQPTVRVHVAGFLILLPWSTPLVFVMPGSSSLRSRLPRLPRLPNIYAVEKSKKPPTKKCDRCTLFLMVQYRCDGHPETAPHYETSFHTVLVSSATLAGVNHYFSLSGTILVPGAV